MPNSPCSSPPLNKSPFDAGNILINVFLHGHISNDATLWLGSTSPSIVRLTKSQQHSTTPTVHFHLQLYQPFRQHGGREWSASMRVSSTGGVIVDTPWTDPRQGLWDECGPHTLTGSRVRRCVRLGTGMDCKKFKLLRILPICLR